MTLPLAWLGDVLREAGLTVVETTGWQERSAESGEPPSPIGVLEHHTATWSSADDPAPSVQLCIDGRSDLEGPLCHGLIGFDGTVHLISAGRANHAGEAKMSGPNPSGDGNVLYVGFEWDYQGVDQAPSAEQYDAGVRATEAVLNHLDRPADAARGHRETTVTDKTDPGHVDLDRFRADIAKIVMDERKPQGSGGKSASGGKTRKGTAGKRTAGGRATGEKAAADTTGDKAAGKKTAGEKKAGEQAGEQAAGEATAPNAAAGTSAKEGPASPRHSSPGHSSPGESAPEQPAPVRPVPDWGDREQDILQRVESELLGPRDQGGEIPGWQTALGPRTVVGMIVDLVNGLLAPQPGAQQPAQQGAPGQAGAQQNSPVAADPDSIKAAFSALPPEQAAPLLAQLVQIQQSRQPTPQQQARAQQQTN